MKIASFVSIAALAAVAFGDVTATVATSSPAPTPRAEGLFQRLLPFWSPRSRRRDLSPSPAVAKTAPRKRDDPPPSEPLSPQAPPNAPPGLPTADPFQIVEPFPPDILTETSTFSGTASDGPSASETSGPSPTGGASDSDWEEAANHGCRLVEAMRVSDQVAGKDHYNPPQDSVQSSLMSYEIDFQGWGWKANEITGNNFTDFGGGKNKPDPGWGIANALQKLSLSNKIESQGGKNHIIEAVHGSPPFTATYNKDGKTFPQTGAQFKIGVNVAEGVLMAMDRVSPASAAKNGSAQISGDKLPALSTFSDVGYLNYKHVLGRDPEDFRYMMSIMITNDKTKSIIAKALQNKGKSLGPYPGEEFSWNTKEFKALLGSPNGMGFGYMLVQHKKQLGSMFIHKVQVFYGDTWHQAPNMVFYLKKFDGVNPPNKSSGAPPKMEEIASPANKRRDGAPPVETMIHVQGKKNFRRAHIVHAEL